MDNSECRFRAAKSEWLQREQGWLELTGLSLLKILKRYFGLAFCFYAKATWMKKDCRFFLLGDDNIPRMRVSRQSEKRIFRYPQIELNLHHNNITTLGNIFASNTNTKK